MLIPVLLLLSLGIVIIYTSSEILAIQQFFFALVGFLFYFLIRSFNYRQLNFFVKPLYLFIIGSLILTLLLGIETRGSIRWVPLGPFNFQPSEFAKPILILTLASFWSTKKATWINIGKSFLLTVPVALLIFRQPDLGTTLTVMFIWISMLFATNISFKKIALLTVSTVVGIPIGWVFLQAYQKQRILSFLSPAQDPLGTGFHIIQSMIAVGSGEFLGKGLGRGTQSRLQFLPEFRTDFIFAFIGEELGFLGAAIIVLGLYAVIFFLLFKTLSSVKDKFGELLIIGVLSMLLFQITINSGMNLGILPITGITFPLLSYGGSSIITTLLSLGLVASVKNFGLRKDQLKEVDF